MNPQFTEQSRLWLGIILMMIPGRVVAEAPGRYGLDDMLSGSKIAAKIRPLQNPQISEKDLETPSRIALRHRESPRAAVAGNSAPKHTPLEIDWQANREQAFRAGEVKRSLQKKAEAAAIAAAAKPQPLTARDRLLFSLGDAVNQDRIAPGVSDLGKFREQAASRTEDAFRGPASINEADFPRHNDKPVRTGHFQGYAPPSQDIE